jgi:xylulose-5-phosphate/fructose-6-phosphate phosphoketolase
MVTGGVISDVELERMNAYWCAANYLSVGQIYLLDNPLLKQPLKEEHIKPRLLGHWGTTPGLNFIYVHLKRVINRFDLNMIYVTGPGHGGPALVANTYLEGSYSEVYPYISQDEDGMQRLFKQFSFHGGTRSHVAPETPGSIHEGDELGYALSHAYGAAFDNPELVVACIVGDGEAETGALAASWHSNKFLNPITDGAVLPILHLNGFKIANTTVLARISREELKSFFTGCGYRPRFVEVSEPTEMHQLMAATLDRSIREMRAIQSRAREKDDASRPALPMIVLITPNGWTGPKEMDGKKTEGSWRSHQVPLSGLAGNPSHVTQLDDWMRSYRPEELFDVTGRLRSEIASLAPKGVRHMGANPHSNGGILLRDLNLPDFRAYCVKVEKPGTTSSSNRLDALFEVTDRRWVAEVRPEDEHLSPNGRVWEILSEHTCQGWLEGYLLTGRHGLFSSYEAFIHIVDSMFNQHAKWLKTTRHISWRRPIASLNYLLSSHVWRQDHNGFSHQDPGFIDHVVNKKAEIIRMYLPPDANTLLSVTDHCLRSRHYINVIVAGKQPALQYLVMDAAVKHCTAGIGIWEWASNDRGSDPDVVLACAEDIPTLEVLAAADLLRQRFPELKVRVVNVVDLMTLQPEKEHPHGLADKDFDAIFTTDRPIIFAFHGYPWLIHRLTYRRTNHRNLHVRGYKEEGTTTTPFDMVVLNELDCYHLVNDVIDRVPSLWHKAAYTKQYIRDILIEHREYIGKYGEDMLEIRNWT